MPRRGSAPPEPIQISSPLWHSAVQLGRVVAGQPQRQHVALPDLADHRHGAQLLQRLAQRAAPGQPLGGVHVLPAGQEVGVDGERHRLHLLAQDRQRAAVDLLEGAAVDVLGGMCGRRLRRRPASSVRGVKRPWASCAPSIRRSSSACQPVHREGVARRMASTVTGPAWPRKRSQDAAGPRRWIGEVDCSGIARSGRLARRRRA